MLTSAIEACRPPLDSPDSVVDESRWTDTSDPRLGPYRLAKTLAEQAAWDLMAGQFGPTILPAAVTGPVLGPDNLHPLQLVRRMLNGSMPRYPHLGFCVVDVRDAADLHIRAMIDPKAGRERFIAAGDWMWMGDVSQALRSELGARADEVPSRAMPDFVLRIVALFQRPVKFVVPLLGRKHVFTSAKAQASLGWKPRSGAASIIDAAHSAIAIGAV